MRWGAGAPAPDLDASSGPAEAEDDDVAPADAENDGVVVSQVVLVELDRVAEDRRELRLRERIADRSGLDVAGAPDRVDQHPRRLVSFEADQDRRRVVLLRE